MGRESWWPWWGRAWCWLTRRHDWWIEGWKTRGVTGSWCARCGRQW